MRSIRSFAALGAFAVAVALAGCGDLASEPATMSYAPIAEGKDDAGRAICGGIAGFTCGANQRCLMHDSFPDASGVCVGQREYTGWRERCAAVRCATPMCLEGFRLSYSGNRCCPTCVRDARASSGGGQSELPEGRCRTIADCDGLVHIMCVGAWSCDNGYCAYTCSSEPVMADRLQ